MRPKKVIAICSIHEVVYMAYRFEAYIGTLLLKCKHHHTESSLVPRPPLQLFFHHHTASVTIQLYHTPDFGGPPLGGVEVSEVSMVTTPVAVITLLGMVSTIVATVVGEGEVL